MIKPIIVLTLIAFVCTASLAAVNMITKEKIAKSAAEKSAKTMQLLIDDKQGFDEIEVSEDVLKKHNAKSLYKSKSDMGYVAEVASAGYGGEISMMVAVSNDGKILGVKVLSHEETNGVGTRVTDSEQFLSQFEDKDVQNGDGVDAVAGATISSKGVTNGVNNASNLFCDVVLKKGGK